jgi:hypothetical protein
MKYNRVYWIVLGVVVEILVAGGISVGTADTKEPTKVAVLWTSGDADVAHRVCFLYTLNAKKRQWFDEVQLIVWGPSARLLAGDKDLQAYVKKMQEAGVDVKACVVCAKAYGVADKLRGMDIDVKPMGQPLTELLQTDWKVLTF